MNRARAIGKLFGVVFEDAGTETKWPEMEAGKMIIISDELTGIRQVEAALLPSCQFRVLGLSSSSFAQ